MAAKKQATTVPIYQLKVTLNGLRPPIWRRIQVPGHITLGKLHEILQSVMGWQDEHPYQFRISDTYYTDPDPGDPLFVFFTPPAQDAEEFKLNRVAPRVKSRFLYQYDMGDDWKHESLVEKIVSAKPGARYPVCLAGERACPPEDCGGVWGYADLLEIIGDPEHEEYEERMERLGEEFDPEKFDLGAINKELASM